MVIFSVLMTHVSMLHGMSLIVIESNDTHQFHRWFGPSRETSGALQGLSSLSHLFVCSPMRGKLGDKNPNSKELYHCNGC